ncbi:MAG: L-threonylcarbamoyladenylate synthase [Bacteroidota bacterium]|nr:L-threonylcarbamoyladenylate synthase [Bacteroidota bacterium]
MQKEIKSVVEALKKGESILYPSDTIWGIGCDATNAQAVEKIYHIKKRDPSQSMLILVSDIYMAQRYLDEMPDIAIQLLECSDTPLTLVIDGAINLAENLPAPDSSIGLRIPDEDFCQEMLRQFRKPVVSTSANFSGQPTATCFQEIDPALSARIDHIVNWRQDERPSEKASSIIRIKHDGEVQILRK